MSLPPLVEPAPSLTIDEVRRYSRHLIIPEVAMDGQKRLKNARVLCVGAGGLGYPEPPPPGMVPSCAEGGVLGVLCASVGSIQVTEAIKLLTGIGEPLVGRLTVYDALEMTYRTIKVRKDPNCALCGENPTITGLIDYDDFCGAVSEEAVAAAVGSTITAPELRDWLDAGKSIHL